MAKQKTAPITLPEYLHSIMSYLEENGHYLGYADGEWVVKTANRRLVASAPALDELAAELQKFANEEEDEAVDWVEEEDDVVELDAEPLDDDDDDDDTEWDDS